MWSTAASAAIVAAVGLTAAPRPARAQYTLTVDSTTVSVGGESTVSWSGPCSHDDLTCWDWISVFPQGTCTGNASTPGANTCYATNDWAWADNWVAASRELDNGRQGGSDGGGGGILRGGGGGGGGDDDDTAAHPPRPSFLSAAALRDEHGSKAFTLTAPGAYEFRMMYCGCGECNYISGEFSECDSYDTFGVSQTVTVPPPIDAAVYAKMSHMSRFVAGLIWKALADRTSPEDAATIIQKMFAPSTSATDVGSASGDDAGCIKDAETTLASFTAVADSFVALYDAFSMGALVTTMEDLATATESLAPVCAACGIEKELPSFFDDVVSAAEHIATRLSTVVKLIKMAVDDVEIYTAVSNVFLTMRQGNYWGAGVFAEELFTDILLGTPGHMAAAPEAAAVADVGGRKSGPPDADGEDED